MFWGYVEQVENVVVFSSVKYVGHFPGKKDWGQKENREQPVVTYVTYIKDNGVSKGLVRKNRKINFQSCFVPFKKKKKGVYSTAEFEKQFTSCYGKYIQSESYNH